MQKLTLIAVLMLSVWTISAPADSSSAGPQGEFLGFPSEDSEGAGTSYLGVDTRDITADRLGSLHLKEESGVEITMVDHDAPAGKAGLKEQDVILTLNGEKIASVEQLRRMIRETPPGRIVSLGISRNGQPMTYQVQLANRKNGLAGSSDENAKSFHFAMPAMPAIPDLPAMDLDLPVSIVVVHASARSGLMVENLSPQLGDYFGVRNGEGVLVRSVEKGSRADKAGFRAGDVITKVNGEPIHDSGDFTHALRSRKDNSVNVSIVRDKKEQVMTLSLPERKQSLDYEESLKRMSSSLNQYASEVARLKPEIEQAIECQYEKALENLKRRVNEMRDESDELGRERRNQVEMELQLKLLERLQENNWE
ncbi:MAG TPA: PDZ domain-containing protein [Terriglobales bacterium]|nr:PDZ domain-containing protein [Terriglobales bacterium]